MRQGGPGLPLGALSCSRLSPVHVPWLVNAQKVGIQRIRIVRIVIADLLTYDDDVVSDCEFRAIKTDRERRRRRRPGLVPTRRDLPAWASKGQSAKSEYSV